jgi:hypothetical protein
MEIKDYHGFGSYNNGNANVNGSANGNGNVVNWNN